MKKNLVSSELVGNGIIVYIVGIIYSFVSAIETHEYYNRTETEVHFDILLNYLVITFAVGGLLLGLGAIVQYVYNIQEKLGAGNSSEDENEPEKAASNAEILKTLLNNGNITQEEYNDEINKLHFDLTNKRQL
ncbi:MAG: hypothetical protein IJW76_09145 [Clostridia bacterium]|nr:hypothetical protein [Clostridia bacterium]